MVIVHAKPKRKSSGARYKSFRGKRKFESGRNPSMTKVGSTKSRSKRIIGGGKKSFLLNANTANIYDTKIKKHVKVKVIGVLESPANHNYVRRNILTKGTIIDTDKGKARITSRPGQGSSLEAIFI